MNFYIDTPQRPRSEDTSTWGKAAIFAAFWSVKVVTDASEANMKQAKLKVDKYTFPIFENTKALKPGDKLCILDLSAAKKKPRS
jgi:hypothetical protein